MKNIKAKTVRVAAAVVSTPTNAAGDGIAWTGKKLMRVGAFAIIGGSYVKEKAATWKVTLELKAEALEAKALDLEAHEAWRMAYVARRRAEMRLDNKVTIDVPYELVTSRDQQIPA